MPNDAQRITEARAAFESGNAEQSRVAHARNLGLSSEAKAAVLAIGAGSGSQVCYNAACEAGHAINDSTVTKCALYGAIDGLSAVAVLLACGAALGLGRPELLRLLTGGCSGLGLAQALRNYVRYSSEKSHFDRERRREAWELSNYREGEEAEMVELYVERGVARGDASTAIHALSKHSDFFVDLMMTQELGLPIPDADPRVACGASLAGFALTSALPIMLLAVYYHTAGVHSAGALADVGLSALSSSSTGADAGAGSPSSSSAATAVATAVLRHPLFVTSALLLTFLGVCVCALRAVKCHDKLSRLPLVRALPLPPSARAALALAGAAGVAAVAGYLTAAKLPLQ